MSLSLRVFLIITNLSASKIQPFIALNDMPKHTLIKNYKDFTACLQSNGSFYDFEDCFQFADNSKESGWFVDANRKVVGYRSVHDSEEDGDSFLKMKDFPEAESIIAALKSYGYRQTFDGIKNNFHLFEMTFAK